MTDEDIETLLHFLLLFHLHYPFKRTRAYETSIFDFEMAAAKVKDFLRIIGPGLLVAVGYIDPGNWYCTLI